MQFIGEYSIKRTGEPLAKAKIVLEPVEENPSVMWLYDKAWYNDAACPEVELYLQTKAGSIPGENYLITVEEIGWASGLFSLNLLYEVLDYAFDAARRSMADDNQSKTANKP
jgi:hypothetical protein